MIKIIAGNLKGRKLVNINHTTNNILRPTQAIVRKSMMDSIRVFTDRKVLDLFSGVGTLGIEAMSRGAKEVTFVDNNYTIINILKKNIDRCNLINNSSIIKSDVISYLESENQLYDIIFADPPYYSYTFKDIFPKVLTLLNNNGIFCYESNRQNIDINDNVRTKHHGNTQIILWENKI